MATTTNNTDNNNYNTSPLLTKYNYQLISRKSILEYVKQVFNVIRNHNFKRTFSNYFKISTCLYELFILLVQFLSILLLLVLILVLLNHKPTMFSIISITKRFQYTTILARNNIANRFFYNLFNNIKDIYIRIVTLSMTMKFFIILCSLYFFLI